MVSALGLVELPSFNIVQSQTVQCMDVHRSPSTLVKPMPASEKEKLTTTLARNTPTIEHATRSSRSKTRFCMMCTRPGFFSDCASHLQSIASTVTDHRLQNRGCSGFGGQFARLIFRCSQPSLCVSLFLPLSSALTSSSTLSIRLPQYRRLLLELGYWAETAARSALASIWAIKACSFTFPSLATLSASKASQSLVSLELAC